MQPSKSILCERVIHTYHQQHYRSFLLPSWSGSLQLGPGTATLRTTMNDSDMRKQIYDVNVAIGGHYYILLAAQMLGPMDTE